MTSGNRAVPCNLQPQPCNTIAAASSTAIRIHGIRQVMALEDELMQTSNGGSSISSSTFFEADSPCSSATSLFTNVDKENFRHLRREAGELGIASESISSIADAQANTADTWDHRVG